MSVVFFNEGPFLCIESHISFNEIQVDHGGDWFSFDSFFVSRETASLRLKLSEILNSLEVEITIT